MSGLRGFVGGLVGLSLLQVVTKSKYGEADRVSGAFGLVASVLSRWLDPSVPLVPDLVGSKLAAARAGANPPSSTSTTGSVYVQPAPGTKPRQTPTGPKSAITLHPA